MDFFEQEMHSERQLFAQGQASQSAELAAARADRDALQGARQRAELPLLLGTLGRKWQEARDGVRSHEVSSAQLKWYV